MSAPELIELDHLPAELLERPASALHRYLGGPALVSLRGRRQRPLAVAVLQHGNEITGWEAVRRLLKKYNGSQELPRSLNLFIGNPLAAKHRVRRLDDQPDYNRCWPGGMGVDPAYAQLFRHIHDRLLQAGPLACIDIHNNTGLNPHYAGLNRIRSDYLRLASLFSGKVVYFTVPGGTLSHAMSEFCPSLTLECGQAGEIHGTDHSLSFLETCLELDEISLRPPDPDEAHLFHMVATVTVDEDLLFGFGQVPAELAFRENLDSLNFCELPAGTLFGTLDGGYHPGRRSPLSALDNEGADVTSRYFSFDGGEIRTRRTVMPSMLTLDRRVIRQDCLCYLMERIHYEDNEEVTGIDPLPEGLPRHD